MAKTSETGHATSVRLAESECAAVDMCDCGALQIHMGSLSLRLPPEVVHTLMMTLRAALSRRSSILEASASVEAVNSGWQGSSTARGKA